MKSRRVAALLGGAFDPPHGGHAALARRALKDFPAVRLFVIPNGSPPHRPPPRLSWARRVALCAAEVADIPRARVGLDEPPGAARRTVDTVRRYRRRGWKVILILGADAYAGFGSWRRWREILGSANIAVARRGLCMRPGAAVRGAARRLKNSGMLSGGVGGVYAWRFRPPDVSSSALRRRLGLE